MTILLGVTIRWALGVPILVGPGGAHFGGPRAPGDSAKPEARLGQIQTDVLQVVFKPRRESHRLATVGKGYIRKKIMAMTSHTHIYIQLYTF